MVNADGYDADGFDEDGFDEDGFDVYGFDVYDFDADGFDADGFNARGYDADGYDADGYDADGYDAEGYDEDGYDADGFDADGFGRGARSDADAIAAQNADTGPGWARDLWVAALRSGKYPQGRGRLGSAEDGYCCLGVAAAALGVELRGSAYDLAACPAVMTAVGLESSDGAEYRCVDMNDMHGYSFATIAQVLDNA